MASEAKGQPEVIFTRPNDDIDRGEVTSEELEELVTIPGAVVRRDSDISPDETGLAQPQVELGSPPEVRYGKPVYRRKLVQTMGPNAQYVGRHGRSHRGRPRKKKAAQRPIAQLMGELADCVGALPDKLVGEPSECVVKVDGTPSLALLDTGSMVSTLSESFWNQHFPDRPVTPLKDLLTLTGAGGDSIPYTGCVEVDLELPGTPMATYPFLVVRDTPYNLRVPVLIGTNVLKGTLDGLSAVYGVRFAQKARLPSAIVHALSVVCTTNHFLKKKDRVISDVRVHQTITLAPGEGRHVLGRVRVTVPIAQQAAMISGVGDLYAGELQLTPTLTTVKSGTDQVTFDLVNHSDNHKVIEGGTLVGSLTAVLVEDQPTVAVDPFISLFGGQYVDDPMQPSWLVSLLDRSRDLFSLHDLDLGCTDTTKHGMHLNNHVPFKEKARRIPPHLYDEVRQHLKQMLDLGVIRPSDSPWTSNVVLVRKPNGELRFCIDLRRVNERTISDAYYLPRIDETLDALAGSKFFSTLDLKSGYWQVEMEESAKQYTAFTVGPLGFFECQRMPFGLKNAPATFQRLMQHVLGDLHLRGVVCYLDDIIIYSKTEAEHKELLEKVLQRLREAGLKLNAKKCSFMKKEIKCLGHIVSAEGIACDPQKTAAVESWPVPTCVKELQKFLGFTGFYRRFIEDYAKIAKPLTKLLCGSNPRKTGRKPVELPWCWGDDQEAAFRRLVHCMTHPPVLCYPDYSKPFLLRTDASKLGLGLSCVNAMKMVRFAWLPLAAGRCEKQSRTTALTRWSSWLCSGRSPNSFTSTCMVLLALK